MTKAEKECNCFSGRQQHYLAHETWCKFITGRNEHKLEEMAEKAFRNYRLYKLELEELNLEAKRLGYC